MFCNFCAETICCNRNGGGDGVLWQQWENISSKGNDVFGFHEVCIVFSDDFFYFFQIVWKQFEQRLLVAEMTQLAILQQKIFVVVSGFINILLGIWFIGRILLSFHKGEIDRLRTGLRYCSIGSFITHIHFVKIPVNQKLSLRITDYLIEFVLDSAKRSWAIFMLSTDWAFIRIMFSPSC